MRTVRVVYVHYSIVHSLVQQTFKNQSGIQDFADRGADVKAGDALFD